MKEGFKTRAVKYFIGFLALMFIMTFVSRALFAARLPKVTCTSFTVQPVVHSIELDGYLEALRKVPVYVPAGLRINTVRVKSGDNVATGTVMIRLDCGYLDEKIAELEKELKDAMEDPRSYSSEGQVPLFTEPGMRIREICVSTGDTVSQGDTLARIDMDHLGRYTEQLRRELNDDVIMMNKLREAGDDQSADAMASGIDMKKSEYDRYKAVYESGGTLTAPISGTVTDVQITTGGITSDSAAVLLSSSPEVGGAAELYRNKLSELRELREKDGEISSPTGGVVTEVFVVSGGMTSETASFIISDSIEGVVFSTELSSAETRYISAKDTVDLIFRGGRIKREDCEVKRIIKDDQGGGFKAEVSLDSDGLNVGEPGQMKLIAGSDEGNMCVPLAALHESSGAEYIYCLEVSESFLGKEYTVRRKDISVIDSNKSIAAIEGAEIDADTKIVLTSSKELGDGQRVRLT